MMTRQVGFRPFNNLNSSASHYQPPQPRVSGLGLEVDRTSKSRKNITFCFSNKDIEKRPSMNSRSGLGLGIKRNSFQMDQQSFLRGPVKSRLSAEGFDHVYTDKSPITSFKVIVPSGRSPDPKKSFFCERREEK